MNYFADPMLDQPEFVDARSRLRVPSELDSRIVPERPGRGSRVTGPR
jgi:hypothetical protein